MPQMTLYLNLPPELMLNIALHQLLLIQDFQRNNKLRFLLPCKVNMTELASAKGLADLEIVNGPFLGLEFLGYCSC